MLTKNHVLRTALDFYKLAYFSQDALLACLKKCVESIHYFKQRKFFEIFHFFPRLEM